jgi:formylmethanofuran dehydrogenase subunit B
VSGGQRVEHVTCLGCGCGCDDVTVSVNAGRIVDAAPICPIGRAWFGDGTVPSDVVRQGQPVTIEEALAEAAAVLVQAQGRCLVYLAPDLSSEAQRAALAVADLLGATVDCATSATAATGLIAGQRRGRAGSTLGEIRNRGDVLLFWGVDPSDHYPRYLSRYALEPLGTQVLQGRKGRFVISVSVGADRGLKDADLSLELDPEEEILALSLMRAAILGNNVGQPSGHMGPILDITKRLAQSRYAVIVHDAEPSAQQRDPLRVEGLIALTQALNEATRATLSSLRAGGNRTGAEAVLTWQTGYPFAVDYSRGHPRYTPGERGLDRLAGGAFRALLLAGTPAIDGSTRSSFSGTSIVAVGPRASQAPFPTQVAIDTGVPGIHESGTAYRMDEVPLPLRPPLRGQRSAAETLNALTSAIRTHPGRNSR